ncbi:MAG TPA: hypothetical protein VNG12_22795 [Acidimicrobiales bacterium]|nr:hypothetical protein [Acidimicrobiales bacterium]
MGIRDADAVLDLPKAESLVLTSPPEDLPKDRLTIARPLAFDSWSSWLRPVELSGHGW